MQISVSNLKRYLQCPRSYKLYDVDGTVPQHKSLSSCHTTATRKAIAELHINGKKACDWSKQEIEEICDRVWKEEIADPTVSQEELGTIVVQEKPATKKQPAIPAVTKRQRILDSIKTWCFEYSREEVDSDVLYSNAYFQTIIGDVTFDGYIDLVRRVPDLGIQVLNFHTGGQAPSPVYLEKDFMLSLYTHALWQGTIYPKYPDMSEKIRLKTIPSASAYYLPHLERYLKKVNGYKKGDRKGNPLINVPQSKDKLLDFEYELLYTVSGIEQEFFPMMPKSVVGCSVCQYTHACNGKSSIFSRDVSFDVEEYEKEGKEIVV